VFKRGEAPLLNIPPSLAKGGGIKRVPGKTEDFSGCLRGEGCQKRQKTSGAKIRG